MCAYTFYSELKGWQGGIGSLLEFIALIVGALWNFRLSCELGNLCGSSLKERRMSCIRCGRGRGKSASGDAYASPTKIAP